LPRTLRHANDLRRLQAQTESLRAYETRFKIDFLSHVSHELRSPLNSIYQFVTILLDRLAGDLNPRQSAHLEIVLRNVQHLQALINDLFEAEELDNGRLLIEPQPVSPADAILDTVNALQFAAAAKKIDLSAELVGVLPLVCADPTRLRQIVSILVDNAIKFTPDAGWVKIMARSLDGNLLLEVADSGCGIHPDLVERIFERMFQASDPNSSGREGLGLGLFICKDLVTRQGGDIRVTSSPGRGAVFSVTLPVFRLSECIRPLVPLGAPFRLLVTEIGSETGWLSQQARAEQGRAVREQLQQCLSAQPAVLLPRMGVSGGVELFFTVAAGSEEQMQELAAQINDRLGTSTALQQAGLTHATRALDLHLQRPGLEGMDLEELASQLQRRMDDEIFQRMVGNGQ
jgi:nitrogen-specific signal transduction histidine kinase